MRWLRNLMALAKYDSELVNKHLAECPKSYHNFKCVDKALEEKK